MGLTTVQAKRQREALDAASARISELEASLLVATATANHWQDRAKAAEAEKG